jgi:outer membrane protein assembly factor BamA
VIKEIRLQGNKIIRDKVIYAAMKSKPGEIYTEETALTDAKWLTQMGVFTSVHFSTIRAADGVILVVTVAEVHRYEGAPALEVTDEDGVSAGAHFTSNSVLRRGTRASVYVLAGGALNFGVLIRDPWIPGKSWLYGYRFDYVHAERRNKIYEFDESSDEVYFSMTRNITDRLRWGVQLMYFTIKSDEPNRTLSSGNRDHIPGVGAFLQFDGRNFPAYPSRGWWTEVNLKKSGLGGVDTDYWQLNLDVRRYIEIGSPKNVFALSSLTTLSTGDVGVDFPVYMQFNLGGANSVRGWSLGSRDGKNQFINTVEFWRLIMRHKSWKFWFFKTALGIQLGVFGDVATAWSSSDEFEQSWIGGGGLGLRFLIPRIVMFRFDVSGGEEGIGVSLAVSKMEKAVAQRERVR